MHDSIFNFLLMVSSYFSWTVTIKPLRECLSSYKYALPALLYTAFSVSCLGSALLKFLWSFLMSVNINNFTMIIANMYFSASLSIYINQVMLMFPAFLSQMPKLSTSHLKEAIICLPQWYLQNKRKPQWICFLPTAKGQMH